MEICSSQCRYLLSIYRLGKERHSVRSVDIANDLGISRPSVSKMMKCMVRMELIYPEYNEEIHLTPEGRELAAKLNQNYDMIYAFFHKVLKLSPAESKDQAFLFLSTFPQSTSNRLSDVMLRSINRRRRRRIAADETHRRAAGGETHL